MILSPQSQLLERNIELFEQGKWLLINPADAYFTEQLAHRELAVMHQYFDVFSESVRVISTASFDSRDVVQQKDGFSVTQKVGEHLHTFAPFLSEHNVYTDVMVVMPKSKAHLQMLLQMAAGAVLPTGRIHVVGENKGGIKSAGKLMDKYGQTNKVDSARHCSLITCSVNEDFPAFESEEWLDERTYEIGDDQWQVVSVPGVFSHGELDNGTQILIEKASSTLRGHVLDFACGAGVVGSYLLKQYPHLKVTFLDVNALALYATAKTLNANGQTADLIAANGLLGVEELFSHIITNPPFHTGVKTDYSVTKRFITDAKRLLKPKGTLQMVANRFLPYPGLLSETFPRVHTLAQNTQFTVYLALS
ncbi:methyltransferase [Alteromonas pelagimontana]|uniref:Ribosomal RNA small subunit methyltransferase C n=1 Tax=Alteromonas pelagimontana TaxID=1858656 RepID=A0A6M4MF76_9ALTE|nr:methyltransferase [Alteromonas pelagimontana]QJR81300.1 methyltransferase [Alteromonas pelagimontana]